MSTNRSRRIDPDTAEHLLGGAVGRPAAGQEASLTGPETGVAHVLAAAAAPPVAGELAGEEAALAAFREARLVSVPAAPAVPAPVRRRSMATAALARAFSTKAVAVVLGATALGGVAVAAGTGNLPSPLGGGSGGSGGPEHPPVAPAVVGSPAAPGTSAGTPGSSPAARRPAGSPSAGGPSTGGSPAAGAPDGTAKPPAPGAVPPVPAPTTGETRGGPARLALIALCRGFADRAGKGEGPRALVTDPKFGALVAAAGGPDKVAEYCGEVLRQASDDDRKDATPQPRNTGEGTVGGNGGKGAASTPAAPVVPTLPDSRPKPERTDRSADASPKR
ncbi:hypothetical protein OH807_23120 [Kitasatospora sp. NBC_01560]|uniref:hypothetical protein n=1 Tax=Kitasatospora sp. NBC_01560 TaxID=2975965 RepID=UPI0038665080